MRTAKCHPQLGWLRLEPYDYSRSLDHLLACRDRDSDLTRSGPSPEYISWMWSTELPGLMRKARPDKRKTVAPHYPMKEGGVWEE